MYVILIKKIDKLWRTLCIKYTAFVSFFSLFVSFLCQFDQGESKRKAIPSWLREELEKMERKRQKEMEKEARENARLEGEREQRAAWRDELDSGDEDEERRRERSGSRRREGREERRTERERERGHSDRESRHGNIRAHHSRSRSPHRVSTIIPRLCIRWNLCIVPPYYSHRPLAHV
jgi:hypothetical protein